MQSAATGYEYANPISEPQTATFGGAGSREEEETSAPRRDSPDTALARKLWRWWLEEEEINPVCSKAQETQSKASFQNRRKLGFHPPPRDGPRISLYWGPRRRPCEQLSGACGGATRRSDPHSRGCGDPRAFCAFAVGPHGAAGC